MRTTHLRSICVALTALGLWLLTGERTSAQPVSSYTFTASSGTYAPITGTSLTAANTANLDDQSFAPITLPFTFTYHGTPFTSVGVDANGFLKMGAASTAGYQAPSQFPDIIGGLAEDFYSLATTTGRDISYTTTGTTPNQVFTVQWTNWGFWNTGLADFNFQIKLYEGSNQIQFVYGAFPMVSAIAQAPQVGLSGATLTDFKLLTTTTSWSAPTLATTNTAQMALSSTVFPASGQTYTFAPPPACTGTPPAGTAVASAASICPSQPFTVTWNSSLTAIGGLSYQLQTSSTGVPASYANSGASQTLPTFTITGITAPAYYRIVVTCTSTGGGIATSVADTVLVNPVALCYCNTNLGGACAAGNANIDGVTFNTLSNLNSGCNFSTAANGSYTQYAPTGTNTTSMVIGSPYTFTITTNAAAITSVWIDYNQDGTWSASEHTQININSSNATATITIPTGALPGQTGMRVRSRAVGNPNGPTDACTNFGSGETEDYVVTLVAPAPCSGTPLAGAANTTNATPCPGAQVTINLTGGTTATGITYGIQTSTTSATTGFGATTTTNTTGIFTLTPPAGNNWYRIVTTCANGGGTVNSVAVQVTGGSPISTLPWNDGFESVTTTGNNFPACWRKINGDWVTQDPAWTTTHDPRTGVRYLLEYWSAVNEWMMTPGFQLTAGTSYDFSFYWIGDTYAGWTGEVGVNNIQDSTGATILGAPFVTATTTTSNAAYQQVIRTFTPTTTGTYFFGVRMNATGAPLYLGFDDFRVNVTPTCPQPNVSAATNVTSSTAQINWTPAAANPALGYQVEVRSSGQPGSGATGLAYTAFVSSPTATFTTATGLTSITGYAAYVRAICSAGDSSFWSSANFTTLCAPYTLPFSENFNTFLPGCWSYATGFLTAAPSALVPSAFGNWVADGYLNNGTTGATKINLYSTFHRDWLITPSINLGAAPGNFQLEFDMAVTVWNATTSSAVLYDSLGTDDTLAVVISTDNGATWSTANALRVFTYADDTLTAQRYYLPFTGSGLIKVGFYASDATVSNCSSCAFPADNDVFIDSVRIISTCSAPNVALGNDTTVCGNVTSLILNAGSGPAGTTYTWSNSFNSATATTQTFEAAPILNALNAAPNNLVNVVNFYSTVTVGPGCAKSDTISVAVTYTPRVSSISSTLAGLDQYDFAPVGDSFATGYVWSFGDGGVAATANATHTYTQPGTYNVCLTVSNPCGTDSVCTMVTIAAGVNDVLSDGSVVRIFPNPTAADAVLEVSGGASLRSYQVMSATGALVQERSVKGTGVTSAVLNTHALAPGIYTLRIQLDKGVVVRKLEVLK